MDRILYFDCFSGISGDMTLAALIDLGIDAEKIIGEIKKLGVSGYNFSVQKTKKYGITGTDVDVSLHEDNLHNEEERNLYEISQIIRESSISEKAKEMALSIFGEIAQAEAAVHGKAIEEVHFHEIGAVDSIVDIVGVAICLDLLGIKKVFCSPLHEGTGFIECRHGVLPIPVPAVAQMLSGSGIKLVTEDIAAELVTPTGIGIIKTLTEGSSQMPPMSIEKVGYGFGKKDTGRLNALRIYMGNMDESETAEDKPETKSTKASPKIAVIETNIDDMTGEMLGYAMEQLFSAGALDVFFTPIQMKKNRPASKLTVLCDIEDKEKMARMILKETSTFGLRIYETDRVVMERRTEIFETEAGPIRFKTGTYEDVSKTVPEYEDCARAAKEMDIPISQVFDLIKKRT